MQEKMIRSFVKSIFWRLLGIFILAGITFFYTQQWLATSLITFIHHGIFLFVFYANERLWMKMRYPKNAIYRSLAKMFVYETVCGNLILGTITYLVTGSWKTVGAITVTYIGIKHLLYIFNEGLIWKYIKWGKI